MSERESGSTPEIARLTQAVESLEARVRTLEANREGAVAAPGGEYDSPPREVEAAGPRRSGTPLSVTVGLVGRSFLILGGAFLLRAVTDGGMISRPLGVGLAMLYAVVWLITMHRSAGRGNRIGASLFGFTALLIIYPLLWETVTSFKLLSPVTAALFLVLITALALLSAWSRGLRVVAWAFAVAAIGTGGALLLSTREVPLYSAVLVLVGIGTLFISYTRDWRLLRWPGALAADLAVLFAVFLVSRPDGSFAAYRHVSASAVQVLALGLPVLYLVGFSLRILRINRPVSLFETLQSLAVLVVGFGGAVRIAGATGQSGLMLGIAAVVAAAVSYVLAFVFVDRRGGTRRNFYYYSWLGLACLFLGSRVVASGASLTLTWCALAVASAILGGTYNRFTLRSQSAVYALAAAVSGGVISAAIGAFTAGASGSWPTLTAVGYLVIASTAVCYGILGATQKEQGPLWHRITPRFIIAILTVMGLGAIFVHVGMKLISAHPPDSDAALLALVRSVIIAVSAATLAMVSARGRLAELAWLVYPLIVVGAIKLLVEDFRNGHAATLFVGLACFGLALIVAARAAKIRAAATHHPEATG